MTPTLHPVASAHGKIILLGEHAVVHGEPALAAGLPDGIRLTARARADKTDPSHISIPEWDLELELRADTEHPVGRACLEVLAHCDGPLTGWVIEGTSRLPARAGLGSSAALSVALARLALGPDADPEHVVDASMAGERVFHGNPSGIDSQVSARGGVLQYARRHPVEAVATGMDLHLVVGPSGVLRSTAEQVAKVAAKLERWPNLAGPVVRTLGQTAAEGRVALERGDAVRLGELMTFAHALLRAVDVSSPVLDRLCDAALQAGALGAKLTGAGHGGCVIALVRPEGAAAVCAALGDRAFEVTISTASPT